MKCPKCGKQNPDGEAFCGSCGIKLPTFKYVCPKCHNGYNDERQFCGSCGTRLVSSYTGERTYSTPKEKAIKIIVWTVCITAAAVISYFLIRYGIFEQ